MTPAFRFTLLWIAGSVFLIVAALSTIAGAYVDGQYVPSNPDAFYHARRILDSVASGNAVAQFDALIHYPEGSWLTWPWGFDTVLATVVGWFGPFASEASAVAVLVHVPVAAAPLATALLVLLCRQLGASLAAAALAVAGFAALPMVFLTFAVGNVDHHFAELLWSLLTLCAGIAFFRRSTAWSGVALGVVLGSAVAVHNGLFILQLPIALALAWRWLRGEPLASRRAVLAFAAALVLTTLAVSAPSEPWRRAAFEFYTLSWFHSYVAVATAVFVAAFATLRPRPSIVAGVALGAVLAAVPLLRSVGIGAQFVSGELDVLRDVTEAMSPYELYALFGAPQSTRLFSWLMWLAPLATLANLYWAARASDAGRQFFAIAAVVLLALMQLQYRFGVLGIVPLLATLALMLDAAAARWPATARWQACAAALGFAVALWPTGAVWTAPRAPGGDPFYADMRPGLAHLAAACERRPGVALAAINDGHWVRYHTRCPVIGNVFLLTEQHARKRAEVAALFDMEPDRLRRERPDIAYVLVHGELELYVPVRADGSYGEGTLRFKRDTLPALSRPLLGPEESLPSGYRELWSTHLPDGQVLGRLLEVER